ncbi:MAG: hypothetical protein ACE5J2_04385 [Nitrososphaerales archaeon]
MSDSQIAGNIIQILAGLPDFLRKPMLKSKLNEFFTLPDAEKNKTVTNALNAVPTIDYNILSNLVKTWFEVLCEFDDDKRISMFGSYVDVISDSPSTLSKLNIDGLISIFNAMSENTKQLLVGSFRSLVQSLPAHKKTNFLAAMPDNAKKVLQL